MSRLHTALVLTFSWLAVLVAVVIVLRFYSVYRAICLEKRNWDSIDWVNWKGLNWKNKALQASAAITIFVFGATFVFCECTDQRSFSSTMPISDLATQRAAAEKGNIDAQVDLGRRYEAGRGAKQDYAEAYFWLSLSANFSKVPEFTAEERDEAAKHLTSEQKEAADRRVRNWMSHHKSELGK